MTEITLPTTEEVIRGLKIGDEVLLTGPLVTARDRAHKYMVEQRPDDIRGMLRGTMIYHCGPVMRQRADGSWDVIAAGPTTSYREEIYQDIVIDEYQVRGVIGKGGMGPRTLAGLKKSGAVYLHAIGGLSQVLAKRVKNVLSVHMLEEFGTPEAFWRFEVDKFPAVVTMDAHGNSLHEEIGAKAETRLKEIIDAL